MSRNKVGPEGTPASVALSAAEQRVVNRMRGIRRITTPVVDVLRYASSAAVVYVATPALVNGLSRVSANKLDVAGWVETVAGALGEGAAAVDTTKAVVRTVRRVRAK